jgi:hypothetical protein
MPALCHAAATGNTQLINSRIVHGAGVAARDLYSGTTVL